MKWQWVVIVVLALAGAGAGAYAGHAVAPEETGVLASAAAFGLALGALLGVLLSGWWKPPKKVAPVVEARDTTEFTARVPDEPPAAVAASMVEHPPPPPPPEGGEPGWYKDQTGVRRYWDGEQWTEIVWRERRGR